MLHHLDHPRNSKKAYAFAAVALAEGVELVFFTLRGVDMERRQIRGYVYKDGQWQKANTDFPDVIYNTGNPQRLARHRRIFARLKQDIPFTTSALGNKMNVYKRLLPTAEFRPYLIPSEPLQSTQHLLSYFQHHDRLIVKPINGHRGQGITYIEKEQNLFKVNREGRNESLSAEQLGEFFSAQLQKTKLMVQPYINSRTKTGQVFDFRLHVQKEGRGMWVITAIYPRIGALGNIVSNIHMGGSTNYLESFVQQEFPDQATVIKPFLEDLALRLARHLDVLHYQLYREKLDEIGIDIGLDDKGRFWIFEVNWRPGCPPAFDLELDVVRNTIHYAMYLARNARSSN